MTVQVFTAQDHGVAELTAHNRTQAQDIATACINGAYVQVYIGVHTVGRSTSQSNIIRWE